MWRTSISSSAYAARDRPHARAACKLVRRDRQKPERLPWQRLRGCHGRVHGGALLGGDVGALLDDHPRRRHGELQAGSELRHLLEDAVHPFQVLVIQRQLAAQKHQRIVKAARAVPILARLLKLSPEQTFIFYCQIRIGRLKAAIVSRHELRGDQLPHGVELVRRLLHHPQEQQGEGRNLGAHAVLPARRLCKDQPHYQSARGGPHLAVLQRLPQGAPHGVLVHGRTREQGANLLVDVVRLASNELAEG
eukprot:4554546-Pyramimonas_sp.AAC.1